MLELYGPSFDTYMAIHEHLYVGATLVSTDKTKITKRPFHEKESAGSLFFLYNVVFHYWDQHQRLLPIQVISVRPT